MRTEINATPAGAQALADRTGKPVLRVAGTMAQSSGAVPFATLHIGVAAIKRERDGLAHARRIGGLTIDAETVFMPAADVA